MLVHILTTNKKPPSGVTITRERNHQPGGQWCKKIAGKLYQITVRKARGKLPPCERTVIIMHRKANGDGSLREKKNGLWEFRVVVGYDIDQKPIRKSFYGKTKTEPKKKYNEWLKQSGQPQIEKVVTLGEWATQWLEIYKKGKVEDGTYRNYAHYVNKHIVPALGYLKFEDIRSAHVEKFMRGKSSLSASAQQHIKIALGAIFDTAIDNGFCVSNPCRKITIKKDKGKTPNVFGASDIASLLELAPSVEHGQVIELLLYTGMRIGEAAALQWRDIDRKEGIITIRHAVARKEGGGYYLKPTKSGKERYIGINDKLAALLDRLPVQGLYVLPRSDSEFEFESIHMIERHYKTAFAAINAKLVQQNRPEVAYLSPHKCRHTYATYLLKGGANLREVQQLLGHSTVGVTEIYTHIDTDDIKSSVAKLPY